MSSNFNAEKYWSAREFKVWVVTLHGPIRRGRSTRDVKYVRARTEQGAKRTAKVNSFMRPIAYITARLATPTDLGCVPSCAA